jgi:glutathione peroxidase
VKHSAEVFGQPTATFLPNLGDHMKHWKSLTLALASVVLCGATGMAAESVHEFKMKNIDGEEVSLADYKGKVLLIVNVASECGLTDQYEQLQAIHEKYKDQGLVVVGIPCNQFGGQEPGSEADIKKFCSTNYKVTFPMMSKVEVNGDKEDPLYAFLKSHSKETGKIGWNFEKFVVSGDGKVAGRISPRVKPDAEEVVSLIEAELKKLKK